MARLYRGRGAVPRVRLRHPLRDPAAARRAALQSRRAKRGGAGPRLQHGGVLHHQHELAELRRRIHAVLPQPDARPDAPELSFGGDRHRGGGSGHPRLLACLGAHRRQLSGSMSRAACSTSSCRCASSTRCSWYGRVCRRRSAPTSRPPRWKAPGRPSRSARRQPGGDQDVRHQRRRLLQRQRRSPLREPDRAVELRADGLDLRHRRGADQHVRPRRRQREAGLGDLCRHVRAVPRRRRRRLSRRSRRQPAAPRAGRRRRQLGGQGAALRHPRRVAVRPRSPPTRRAAPSTPCSTASPRSAA